MLTVVLAVVVVALLLGFGAQRWAEARDRARFPAPGSFVEVDGVRLHVVVEGEGPAVLFDSGLGGSCLEWEHVAAALKGTATVVRYDRPGFGWSPSARCDRSPVATARRMLALLDAVGQAGPVVLVGHSLGGLHVRVAAALAPDRVRGLVLVDPSHEDMLDIAPVPRSAKVVEGVLAALAALSPFGVARLGGRMYAKVVAGQVRSNLDAQTWAGIHRATLLTACSVGGLRAVVAELKALPGSLREVKDVDRAHPLPDLPLTVISAAAPARTDAERHAHELMAVLHTRQADAVPRGRRVLAHGSGHLVPLDEPDLVATCVRDVLAVAR